MLSEEQKRRTALIITEGLGNEVTAVYAFGSQITGGSHASSDVDLAILTHRQPDPDQVLTMKGRLSAYLSQDVDLIDLMRADTVTKAQVISTGELIFDAQPAALAAFETTALSQYALLNEERAGILLDIIARGSVYGR